MKEQNSLLNAFLHNTQSHASSIRHNFIRLALINHAHLRKSERLYPFRVVFGDYC